MAQSRSAQSAAQRRKAQGGSARPKVRSAAQGTVRRATKAAAKRPPRRSAKAPAKATSKRATQSLLKLKAKRPLRAAKASAKRPARAAKARAKRPAAPPRIARMPARTAKPGSAAKPASTAKPGSAAKRAPATAGTEARGYRLPPHLVVSPDITKHPWENRRDYLILVAAIAASDSELHPDELKLLETWMDRFQLPPQAREEVLHVANQGEVNLLEIAQRLAGTSLTWSVMLDMMGMAMADGVLMDDEIMLLRGLASVLQIDPIDFNILIEFVHSAHQGAQLSNPEPLYEHAIESAFHLLSKRHVKLFEHTRLCVNFPEYDQQLKHRWAAIEAAEHAA